MIAPYRSSSTAAWVLAIDVVIPADDNRVSGNVQPTRSGLVTRGPLTLPYARRLHPSS